MRIAQVGDTFTDDLAASTAVAASVAETRNRKRGFEVEARAIFGRGECGENAAIEPERTFA